MKITLLSMRNNSLPSKEAKMTGTLLTTVKLATTVPGAAVTGISVKIIFCISLGTFSNVSVMSIVRFFEVCCVEDLAVIKRVSLDGEGRRARLVEITPVISSTLKFSDGFSNANETLVSGKTRIS